MVADPNNGTESRLIAFLSNPASYEHRPSDVRVLQTHASIVAIAGPFVFKVKKPVNFGFLDFSTLDRRHHFCNEEVRLNRRLCAKIYEGVVPIYQDGEHLTFDAVPNVEPAEYAVKMRHLAEAGFLDALIRADSVPSGAIDRIAARLQTFYTAQSPTEDVRMWGSVDRIAISIDENFDQTRAFRGREIPAVIFDHLRWYNDHFLSSKHDQFERRLREQRILNCHGDLRAEHIHFDGDDICIYDCIEFNERLRFIDVASDIAFLAMDLRNLGRSDLASELVLELTSRLDDPLLATMLPFYGSYRAFVRGKVELMKSTEEEVPDVDRSKSRNRAEDFFSLSMDYSVTGGSSAIIAFMGRVGAGKSTVAQRMSDVLGWQRLSSDWTRKKLSGIDPFEHASETHPEVYGEEVTARVYRALAEQAIAASRSPARRSSLIDATFSKRLQRDALRRALEHDDARLYFVETIVSDEAAKARLRKRESDTGVVSDARIGDFDALNARYEPPAPDEVDIIRIRTDDKSIDETVSAVLRDVSRRGTEL